MYEEAEEKNPKYISRTLVSKVIDIIFEDSKLKKLTPIMKCEDYSDDMYMTCVTFKEIKNWSFGLWMERSETNEDEYVLSYFGEHSHHLNKFSPTQTIISYEDSISDIIKFDNSYCDIDFKTYWYKDFIADILKLKYAPYATYWNLYTESYEKWWQRNKYTFHFKEWLEYKKNER